MQQRVVTQKVMIQRIESNDGIKMVEKVIVKRMMVLKINVNEYWVRSNGTKEQWFKEQLFKD